MRRDEDLDFGAARWRPDEEWHSSEGEWEPPEDWDSMSEPDDELDDGSRVPQAADFLRELEDNANNLRIPIERSTVITVFVSGQERDPIKLASLIFHGRHPELGGRKIAKGETALSAEWNAIMRDVVKPALKAMGLDGVDQSDLKRARWIANRAPVPGHTGLTVSQLIEKYRPSICPEIPLPLLIAFIRYEAGHNLFDDATHGTSSQDPPWSEPSFYELGLFQTRAGLHGKCTGPRATDCEYAPPGKNANDSTWHKLCKGIGADPDDWQNPITQARVGLMDLGKCARSIRKKYPRLFPTPGTDWDLRAAVLLCFGGGPGFTSERLARYSTQLLALPENERWAFLRSKGTSKGERKRYRNVDKKVALAWYLGYTPQAGLTPSPSAPAPAPAPTTSTPPTPRPRTNGSTTVQSPPGLYTRPGSGTSCPEMSPGMPTRCPDPETVGRCPEIPDLLCVKDVMGVGIEWRKAKRRSDDIYEITGHGAHTSKFVPGVGTSLGKFVTRMTGIAMSLEALYMGDYNCRCLTGRDKLSPHAKGIAVDIYGVRLTSPVNAGSPRKSVLEASFRNTAERQILMRINACLRLSFPLVLDYNFNKAHEDHFHCDLSTAKAINSVGDLHRARPVTYRSNVVFVQEALNALGHRSGKITGKLYDENTIEPLARYGGMTASAVDDGNNLNVLTDRLCEDIAAGKHLGQVHELEIGHDADPFDEWALTVA